MELIYLWIEDPDGKYQQISNMDINLNGKYNCHFDESFNELHIEENEDYVDGIFENNVRLIYGRNGTGKTSILNFIDGLRFVDGFNYGIKSICFNKYFENKKFITVFKFKNEIYIFKNEIMINIFNSDFKIIIPTYEHIRITEKTSIESDNIGVISKDIRIDDSFIEQCFQNKTEYTNLIKDAFFKNTYNLSMYFEIDNFLELNKKTIYLYDIVEKYIDKKEFDKFNINIKLRYDKINNLYIAKINTIILYYKIMEFLTRDIYKIFEPIFDNHKNNNSFFKNFFYQEIDLNEMESYDFLAFFTNFSRFIIKDKNNKVKDFNSSKKELFRYRLLSNLIYKSEIFAPKIFDEIDTHFDMQNNKNFIRKILNNEYFNINFYSENYQFNNNTSIFFTTHSPSILTDIPSQDILFLDFVRNKQGYIQFENDNGKKYWYDEVNEKIYKCSDLKNDIYKEFENFTLDDYKKITCLATENQKRITNPEYLPYFPKEVFGMPVEELLQYKYFIPKPFSNNFEGFVQKIIDYCKEEYPTKDLKVFSNDNHQEQIKKANIVGDKLIRNKLLDMLEEHKVKNRKGISLIEYHEQEIDRLKGIEND